MQTVIVRLYIEGVRSKYLQWPLSGEYNLTFDRKKSAQGREFKTYKEKKGKRKVKKKWKEKGENRKTKKQGEFNSKFQGEKKKSNFSKNILSMKL